MALVSIAPAIRSQSGLNLQRSPPGRGLRCL